MGRTDKALAREAQAKPGWEASGPARQGATTMDELQRVGRRYRRQRRALEVTYAELVPLILAARQTMSLRAIANLSGLSFARIHQIEKEAKHG